MHGNKGLSQIITTIIMILIAIVAVFVVWGVVSNILKGGQNQANLNIRCSNINLEIDKETAKCNATETNALTAKVNRGSDEEGNIQLKLIAGESVVTQDAPQSPASKIYTWNGAGGFIDGSTVDLSVAAVITQDNGKAYTCQASNKITATCTA